MNMMPPPPPSPPPPPPGYTAYAVASTPLYAGFGSRLGAYIIDGLVGLLFAVPAIAALFAGPKHIDTCTINHEVRLCNVPTPATVGATVALGAVAAVIYIVLYCRRVGRGQSWGQQAVGIRVVDAETGQPIGTGRAVGRFFGRYLSAVPCYLGFLWMLWDSRKQTWHDKLTNSLVVRG